MRKIVSSVLVFAMVFTSWAVCFAGGQIKVGVPQSGLVEHAENQGLIESSEIYEKEKPYAVEDLEVVNENVDMEVRSAGKSVGEVVAEICFVIWVLAVVVVCIAH